MKLFFHGLLVCLGLVASVTFTGCGTTPTNSVFYMDTPQPRVNSGSSTAEVKHFPPQPHSSDVARFRVAQTVIVIFSGTPEPISPHEEVIKEDGTITLPLIGSIYAAGKTAGELQNEIYTNYVPKYYVRLTVTVKSGDLVYYGGGEIKGGGRPVSA